MQHLIIGYGYCGYYLAKHLLAQKEKVIAISRHLDKQFVLKDLNHLCHDISKPFPINTENTILYYLAPPLNEGKEDKLLALFLSHLKIKPKKMIYFGSSAVYGNHNGAYVKEDSSCNLLNDRQYRRLDAEKRWQNFANQHESTALILRVAGIYGPHRLPITAARNKNPIINPLLAPFSNYIYVKDLVDIAYRLSSNKNLSGLFNVADGCPQPMGALQLAVAEALNIEVKFHSLEEALAQASPRLGEFITASKKIDISALQKNLGKDFSFTLLQNGVRESLSKIY